MTNIPKNMGNEESKLVAAIIVKQRAYSIVKAELMAAKNKYSAWLAQR